MAKETLRCSVDGAGQKETALHVDPSGRKPVKLCGPCGGPV